MNKDVPEAILESIKHFSERAKATVEAKKLVDEFLSTKKLDFDDIESVENRAKLHIEMTEGQYQAGLLSEQEFMFHQTHAIIALIHETRWMNGFYSSELHPISEKMRTIERAHGLSADQYWAKGDAPKEYQILNQQYEQILESKLESEFIEFAPKAVSDLFVRDRRKFKALSELGRRSIFINDEIDRLNDLANIYEVESKINEKGKAYFSASIMLAAAMEARLIVQCIKNRDAVRNTLLTMGLSNKKLKSKNPLDWKLNTLIEVCSNAGWLPDIETQDFVFYSKNIGHALRITRNLVHAGMHVKRNAPLGLGEEQFKDTKAAYALVSKLLNWPENQIQSTAEASVD